LKILIVGGGGREHALAWKAAQSPLVEHVYVAPGNAGTALLQDTTNVPLEAEDIAGLRQFAADNDIGLTIVGPEAPLVAGIVDNFTTAGLRIFGPTTAAAELEGSKAFCKAFLQRHNIPTADYQVFSDAEKALRYVHEKGAPIVVKADGLAAGKGVFVAETLEQAEQAVREILAENKFGDAGNLAVVEEFLQGQEVSFICMADGQSLLPLATSQDHKARDEGDLGPNTGGMGAYSPAPLVDADLHQKIMQKIMQPTLEGMAADGRTFSGFLYAGLMVDKFGEPKVLEFNVRFGDPETQPILMRLQSDIVAHCLAATEQRLNKEITQWSEQAALGVVMAAGGYPHNYRKGDQISGLQLADQSGAMVFHAGTELRGSHVYTCGGRVLCVTALGDSIQAARDSAYAATAQISWDDVFYRRDIGHRAL